MYGDGGGVVNVSGDAESSSHEDGDDETLSGESVGKCESGVNVALRRVWDEHDMCHFPE